MTEPQQEQPKKRKATRRKTEPVEVRNIAHPRVWKTAMKLAGNDAKRITIETFVCVSVTVKEAG